ncbi:MAG: thioredoxin [Acholeplasmataceae bacterium]|nr:thioredoxin [Acholeplasmataceae bacterium]
MVKHLKTSEFKKEVLESDVPVLVDFWAKWCSPCLRVAPILDELSDDVKGVAKICKLEVDEEYEIADLYDIMSIPTIAVFVNGEIKDQMIGVQSKKTLMKLLGL